MKEGIKGDERGSRHEVPEVEILIHRAEFHLREVLRTCWTLSASWGWGYWGVRWGSYQQGMRRSEGIDVRHYFWQHICQVPNNSQLAISHKSKARSS